MNNDLIGNTAPELTHLSREVKELIVESRSQVTVAVNVTLTMLYWQIGKRINEEVLKGERAEYGKQIVSTLSGQLSMEFGKGFAEKNLRRMMQFATVFEDHGIVATLLRQLSWSHFTLLIPLKDKLQRNFYAEMCRLEKWSVRTLRKRIDSMLFERTALSKKPEELITAEIQKLRNDNRVTPNLVLKDPYILDFLELNDRYFEKDLEDAILREMEQFLLELGSGFAFMARQKRIQIDNDDYYIDLLFYHRDLNRLIVIDLKLGDFKAQYKGQMELYLRWLSKHERRAGEAAPLGIILCAGKKQELVELLELGQSGIHVAEYLTVLPEKELLQKRLHDAMTNARLRLENRGDAL